MFDFLFENPLYPNISVTSDSNIKELKKNPNQELLDEITNQRTRLKDTFKAQLKYHEEREKEIKK